MLARTSCDVMSGTQVLILVLTLWKSMDAIEKFAGNPVDRAVIAPAARAMLDKFD